VHRETKNPVAASWTPNDASPYYAHAMCIYGHLVESKELAVIRRRFKGSVVNPANYDEDPEKW
jgi:hypothetical protein